MYQTISFSMFCDAFIKMGREDQFTYEGKRHLFDYIEEYEECTGDPIELDIIELCCQYSEDPLSEVLKSYNLESLDELQGNTHIVNFDEKTGLVLYQQY